MSKNFDCPLTQQALNLESKTRSNVFSWRGQFSPELVENLLEAYCLDGSVVLDPFCGSGTVLCEAGLYGLEAVGIELNPAAYILSKTYELVNVNSDEIDSLLKSFVSDFQKVFPKPETLQIDGDPLLSQCDFERCLAELKEKISQEEEILLDAFVILLDIHKNDISPANIYSALFKVIAAVKRFPHSKKRVAAILGDSRKIPLGDRSVDFVVTSPPYINVFNYHQNYRRSAESLGWDLLKIAKSEIGSNRANRGNRFLTVIQYCLDMMATIAELHRVMSQRGRMIFVVGHESRVLGVPLYNAEIISMLATQSRIFDLVLRQSRMFKNKFGKLIREDILHLEKQNNSISKSLLDELARNVAIKTLRQGLSVVPSKNRGALMQAMDSVEKVMGTPLYHSDGIRYYKNDERQVAQGA